MLLKVTGSRNNLPLRVQSPVEAPISNEKEGFSLETEGYDSIKSWFRLEINVVGKNRIFGCLLSQLWDLRVPQKAKKWLRIQQNSVQKWAWLVGFVKMATTRWSSIVLWVFIARQICCFISFQIEIAREFMNYISHICSRKEIG